MHNFIKNIAVVFCVVAAQHARAQIVISGTVYDSSKTNLVEGVRVKSTNGLFAVTDSLGRFRITVGEIDSLTFYYHEKPTQKFAVTSIPDPNHLEIAIGVTVKGKYSTLKEVIVRTRSYREDSIENRKTYADIFNYHKPGISPVLNDGVAGMDLDELINIFRFKRNKQIRKFQERLEEEERQKYVSYRFNKLYVKRITQLEGDALDKFLVTYRPTYEFTLLSDELTFNQYILDCLYQYKAQLPKLGGMERW